MTLTLRLALLLPLAPALSFAATWTGALVDARCFASAQQNISHGHPGSTDTKAAVRSCSPNHKTDSFSLVERVGATFNLDSHGNEKAHELVLKKDTTELHLWCMFQVMWIRKRLRSGPFQAAK